MNMNVVKKASVTCTKQYRDFCFFHRQHKHDGHCRYVHGHATWGFDLEFICENLDSNGFVVDFGKLKAIKQMLDLWFDHTICKNDSDPFKEYFYDMQSKGICDLRVLPDVGAEGLAQFVFGEASKVLKAQFPDRPDLRIKKVVCWEDSKNYATYEETYEVPCL